MPLSMIPPGERIPRAINLLQVEYENKGESYWTYVRDPACEPEASLARSNFLMIYQYLITSFLRFIAKKKKITHNTPSLVPE